MSAIEFRNLAMPDFSDSNQLLRSSGATVQDAFKGITDTLKAVQTDVRARNGAILQEYINKARSQEDLQNPEFIAGYNALRDSMQEVDLPQVNKYLDDRNDVLVQRATNQAGLQHVENQLLQDPVALEQAKAALIGTQQANKAGAYTYDRTIYNDTRIDNTDKLLDAYARGDMLTVGILQKSGNYDPEKIQQFRTGQLTYNQAKQLAPIAVQQAKANVNATNAGIGLTNAQVEASKAATKGQNLENIVSEMGVTALQNNNPWASQSKNYSSNITKFQKAIPRVSQYDGIMGQAAQKYGVEHNLLRALVTAESGGVANARSEVGASGLGQIIPGTRDEILRETGIDAYKNPESNIMATAYYLSKKLKDNGGDVTRALAAYNAGQGRVNKYKGVPPFKETRDYIERISDIYSYLGSGQDGKQVNYPAGGVTVNGKTLGNDGTAKVTAAADSQTITNLYKNINDTTQQFARTAATQKSSLPKQSVAQWLDKTTDSSIDSQPRALVRILDSMPDAKNLTEDEKVALLGDAMVKFQNSFGSTKWYNSDKDNQAYKQHFTKAIADRVNQRNAPVADAIRMHYLTAISEYQQRHQIGDPITAAYQMGLSEQDIMKAGLVQQQPAQPKQPQPKVPVASSAPATKPGQDRASREAAARLKAEASNANYLKPKPVAAPKPDKNVEARLIQQRLLAMQEEEYKKKARTILNPDR